MPEMKTGPPVMSKAWTPTSPLWSAKDRGSFRLDGVSAIKHRSHASRPRCLKPECVVSTVHDYVSRHKPAKAPAHKPTPPATQTVTLAAPTVTSATPTETEGKQKATLPLFAPSPAHGVPAVLRLHDLRGMVGVSVIARRPFPDSQKLLLADGDISAVNRLALAIDGAFERQREMDLERANNLATGSPLDSTPMVRANPSAADAKVPVPTMYCINGQPCMDLEQIIWIILTCVSRHTFGTRVTLAVLFRALLSKAIQLCLTLCPTESPPFWSVVYERWPNPNWHSKKRCSVFVHQPHVKAILSNLTSL